MPEPEEKYPGENGERYDESMNETFEEELDPEEAERRISQFVTSADNLPGPPVE